VLDDVLGRALVAQAVAVGVAIGAGLAAYAALVRAMELEEARQIQRLFADRLRRPGTA
jgi:hypothetical protein